MKKIVFVGSGAIATALGNVLAIKNLDDVTMLSVEDEVVEAVNNQHYNINYFPNVRLSDNLKATKDKNLLRDADVIFMAIPSTAVVDYLNDNQLFVNPSALIVNLAKGFGNDSRIIPDCLADFMPNPLMTLKGPSFAREIINRQETGLTAASNHNELYHIVKEMFNGTTVRTDFTNDVAGVEYVSILKNIYAILIGMVDANFD